ncbi:PREDICTED: F-box/kelch-repeat protein At3g23880-like [Fragaria vesca subsp. vesca]|uniref:F-box/kelch-repeat protein At3g23880-like n=1 Tax=Fragaria vesca subsp. vesca TaxID=101020 RepID=UPI0002C33FA9|nr:PREDICTED: F-box/kelch-repeat protein At3g23880-like [Fragaria vesca subsp. vesca]
MSGYFVPEEIIHEILLRLPAKSLVRFSTVCKSWSSMITRSSFIDTHLKRRGQYNKQNGIVHLLLCEHFTARSCTSYVMKDDPAILTGDECYTKFTYPSIFKHSYASLIGTCNGLICLTDHHSPRTTSKVSTIIWNPSIRKIVILPRPSIKSPTICMQTHHAFGFGYDAQSNDYKVLRILKSEDERLVTKLREVEVYSLARNTWKRLSCDTFPACLKSVRWCTGKYVFVNNALHWAQYRDSEMEKYIIVSFDMAGELFSEIEMPEALSNEPKNLILVARYGESLALIDVKSGFDIWVMKEYGVVQSWTKIARISCEKFRSLSLFDCKSCGELVFGIIEETTTGRGGLRRVNYQTNQVEKFRIDVEKYKGIDSFVDSIVLLDQINAIYSLQS